MNGLLLFGRLRRWTINVIVAACSGLAILAAGPLHYSLNPNGGYLIAVIAQIPLVSAIVLQASAVSPLHPAERHAARQLRRFRALHYIGMSSVAGLILGLAASVHAHVSGPDQAAGFGAFSAVRDLCALTGAAFIGASLIGSTLGWTLPTAWAVLPYVLLTQTSSQHEVLTLVTQPDNSFAAFAVAFVVWLTGLILTMSTHWDVLDLPAGIGRVAVKIWAAPSRQKRV